MLVDYFFAVDFLLGTGLCVAPPMRAVLRLRSCMSPRAGGEGERDDVGDEDAGE